jgi:predicted GNAT family N-acyltransferase
VAIEIGPIDPERSIALRHAVLRPHQRLDEVTLDGADAPDAIVMAATDGETGEVLCTAAIAPEEAPRELAEAVAGTPGRHWRLRSMATTPARRSTGLGGAVLAAAIAHVAKRGGGVVWCSARLPAKEFYVRAGFVAVGDVWEAPMIGPHQLMWRAVVAEHREDPDA